MEKKRGRPPKKTYGGRWMTSELLENVSVAYAKYHEIKATALALALPPHKVKKLLITHGDIHYSETDQIIEMQQQGMSISEIARRMGMSPKTVNTYLPYSKVVYKLDDISQNAERVKKYQQRKKAVERLHAEMTTDALWECVVAFQEYLFHTAAGLLFRYTVGRNEDTPREILLGSSQSDEKIDWRTMLLTFDQAIHFNGAVERPEMLGDIRGITYLYSRVCSATTKT